MISSSDRFVFLILFFISLLIFPFQARAVDVSVTPQWKWGSNYLSRMPYIFDSFEIAITEAKPWLPYNFQNAQPTYITRSTSCTTSGSCIEYTHQYDFRRGIGIWEMINPDFPVSSIQYLRYGATFEANGVCPTGYTLVGATTYDQYRCVKTGPSKDCPNGGTHIGNPCSAATGAKLETAIDYQASGLSPLKFTRNYTSLPSYDPRILRSQMGSGWHHSYASSINLTANAAVTTATVRRPDGRLVFFNFINGVWVSDSDIPDRLIQSSDGWTYYLLDGTVETYDSRGRLVSLAYRSGLSQTMNYDAADNLVAVKDTFGNSLTFAYTDNGLMSALIDPVGQITRYEYAANNNLIRVIYPDNVATLYHYENSSYPFKLTGISQVDGSRVTTRYSTYSYDSTGRAISTEHNGGQNKYLLSYASQQVYPYYPQTTVTDAANNKEVMTFITNLGARNLISKVNLSDNKSLTQTFDANNNLTCKKDEEGRVVTYTYNSSNQKLSETVGQTGTCSAPVATSALRTTTYQYLSPTLDLPTLTESPSVYGTSRKRVVVGYTNNLPTTITQSGFTPSGAAVSRTVTMTYNTSGQVTSIDGPRSDVADVNMLTYNDCTTGGGCGQLQRVTNALGHVTTYDSYDANGRVLRLTDPNGLVTAYTYDARGRVASVTHTAPGGGGGGSRVTSYSYDAAGNVTSTTLPTGLVLTYTYDAALNLRRVLDSLGNYIDYGYDLKGNRTQTYTYDATGTLVRAVDLAFNTRNRVSQLNAGGSITKQVWDAVGNLTSVTDPNTVAQAGSSVTSNSYDSLNRLFQTVDLLAGITQYSYDPNDRLKTVSAPNGSVTQYQYDDLGNLLQETSPDRGATTYAYDAAGNLVRQTDARGITVAYRYDALNRLTSQDYPGTLEDVSYVYDNLPGGSATCSAGLGRLCQVSDAGGISVYGYDGFGNVVLERRTELGVNYTTRYTYDAGNRVVSLTYPNGRGVNYTRNLKGDVVAVNMTLNGVNTTLISSLSYRPDGLPLSLAFGNNLTDTRTYDTQGRLTYQSIGTADTRLYTYDANGNLTKLQSLPQVGTYTYDVLDRLKQEDRTTQGTVSSTWTYDLNGNRKTENSGTYAYLANSNRLQSTPSGTISLDAMGNTLSDGIRSYTYNNAGHLAQVNTTTYSYNAKRQRSRKVVGSQVTVFHYDLQGNLITETNASGNLIRDYVWVGAMPIAQVEAGAHVRYLHGDHLNTPRLATNQQGQVIWRWEGEAFGGTLPNEDVDGDGVKTVINLRFAGQYWDAESSLHYNWNRYYDPRTGRYLTPDPIGLAGGLNSFSYVGSNPLYWIDPLGLYPTCFRGPPRVSISTKTVFEEQILFLFRMLHPENYSPSFGGNFPPEMGRLPVGPEVTVDWWVWEHSLKQNSEFEITKTITVTTVWCTDTRNCKTVRFDYDETKEDERKQLVRQMRKWFHERLYKAGSNNWSLP